jgi:hypothetical protein
MPIIEFLKTSDNTYTEVSATNPLPTTATISGGTVTADTELLAPTALADATANPTITQISSYLMGFNGTTWDRVRVNSASQLVVSISSYTATAAAALLDSFVAGISVQTHNFQYTYNGTNWDRQRGNTQNTLLASAARTVTTSSADQTNYNASGVTIVVDVTVIPSGSLTLTIEGKDALSGKYFTLLTGAAISTVSTNVYQVYPALTAVANLIANNVIPRTYRVTVTAGDATSITYSVASLLNL